MTLEPTLRSSDIQLALLEHKWEADPEDDDVTSHNRPITVAIYNHLFNQVVSACHDSVVSVWDLATGTKTIMFSKVPPAGHS